MNTVKDINLILRRELLAARNDIRAITLWPMRPDGEPTFPGDPEPSNNIEASGAVHLDIQDIIPVVDAYATGLPAGVQMQQGVVGDEVWPVSADDVELDEKGEVQACSEQTLTFGKIAATPHRVTLRIDISNAAIDNAGFDLVGFIRGKVRLAMQKYLARHFYSFEPWPGNQGPFVDAAAASFEGSLPDVIRDAMTNLHNAGFDLDTAAVVMNVDTELRLKQTPIDPAVPQMIIENDLCCGYPYIVNKYFGTMKDSDGQLESPYPFCLGVGVFNWCAVSQHAGGRIILDGSTAKTAGRNITSMVVNTWWSMTNMASHMTTSDGSVPAFQIVAKGEMLLADRSGAIFVTSDGYVLVVSE